jgi:hypothetical protein
MPLKSKTKNRYAEIIQDIFKSHYRRGIDAFEFERAEIERVAKKLEIVLPKNQGDLIYSFRYRVELPVAIASTAPKGREWVIMPAGRARYRFSLTKINRIAPRGELIATKIPDATPEIVAAYTQGDEQALLAKLRYNRLIDLFLGLTTYSLQNHMRTTVKGVGQIEIDELYVGVDRVGAHHVIPIQAKGGKDQLSVIQTSQDIDFCHQKFPKLRCRAISAQFIDKNRIALFELTVSDGEIKVVDERHYVLVASDQITDEDLRDYQSRSS